MGPRLLRASFSAVLLNVYSLKAITMTTFIQVHLLTSYPPSNLNRDDLNRPKTCVFGGAQRLRISSQSLKRAWRTSDVFVEAIANSTFAAAQKGLVEPSGQKLPTFSTHTKHLPAQLRKLFQSQGGLDFKNANGLANEIAKRWGDLKAANTQTAEPAPAGEKVHPDLIEMEFSQVVHVAAAEWAMFHEFAERLRSDESARRAVREPVSKGGGSAAPGKRARPKTKAADTAPSEEELPAAPVAQHSIVAMRENLTPLVGDAQSGGGQYQSVDLALFGRMLASSPAANVEAAMQVAHALTVERVNVEDDFFTAVDDLNHGAVHSGSAHMGNTEFASGLFYLYACIDTDLLKANLGDGAIAPELVVNALLDAMLTVAPTGKQNSFASRARASYGLVEVGSAQPRNLSLAFLKPVGGTDIHSTAVERIQRLKTAFKNAYGDELKDAQFVLSANEGADASTGSVADLKSQIVAAFKSVPKAIV